MAIERKFEDRHIGPAHRDEEAMLKALGYKDLDSFISAVVPANIAIKGVIEGSIGIPASIAAWTVILVSLLLLLRGDAPSKFI